jgi:site-specific DNA-adenine methylase
VSLAPLIKHPGGKRKIAPVVAELLGHPEAICELVAGGLGASLVAGIRPAVSAEAIPAIRALYTVLAENPASLWAALDALPESVDEAGYYAARKRFNAGGASDPALYIALNAWCFNGLARFNDNGGFSTAVGRSSSGQPLVRPSFKGQRAAYAQRFEDCVCFADWRQALEAATAQGLKVFADPPYLGTFGYGGTWGIGDLCALADALPLGALVCERIQPEPRQASLFGEPQTAAGILAKRGFKLVHTWAPRESISCGERVVRSEGVWRKVAA